MKNQPPDSSVSGLTTSFAQVISLCEGFTGEWKPESRPSIGPYLDRVPNDAQPTLLRNLLAIEIENRRAAGDQPQVNEYLERFPQFAALVREAFVQHSTLSEVGGRHSTGPKAAGVMAPVASRLGDYQLLRELGRGGMGVVYEGCHVQRGNHVALKTLPAVDGTALHHFKHEFRALADINHPNLIGLHTLEADGCHWFFTMDLIEGDDFFTHVRPTGTLDEARLRSALSQLVVGVMALHGHHIVHRDLKPSNVMVKHDGHLVLLDFGLVLEFEEQIGAAGGGEIAGTPKYMAPEQAAGLAITPASDWYAVGGMLYEALTGHAPFMGSLHKVLRDKQNLDAPPLPEGGGIPADLAALCMKLLARDPQQRPDALQIARVIASQVGVSKIGTMSGWHLVGRAQHLASLEDAHRALLQQREPVTVFISGRSGEGKTSLAEHFLKPLRLQASGGRQPPEELPQGAHAPRSPATVVLSGRCYDRESVPFKALDSLIDALATFLQSLPEAEATQMMPADIGVLAQVFPVLQRVEAVAAIPCVNVSALNQQQVRERAFAAFRELLHHLSGRAPLLLFVDDLQWGDADSAEVLFKVLRPPQAPVVLFLGSYRSDEVETSPFLRAWEELKRKHDVTLTHQDVKVVPLSLEECTELVIALLGKDNEAIRRRAVQMAAETGGNPFLLIELVGCFDPETDSFQPMEMHEVLARKLGRLPAEAGHLLEVVSVSGQALSLEEASRTAGHPLPPVATLMHMRNERLVRLVGPEERPLVDTYHDRVRETILGRMEAGTCKTIHLALARVIEENVGGVSDELVAAMERGEKSKEEEEKGIPRVYDLAYHYDAAGEKQKAWIYALRAAEQARRQSALEVAVNNYAIAKRNADETNSAVRYRIAEGCGDALMLLGRYEEANEQLAGAIDLVEEAESKARIEALQGELAFKQGLIDKSMACYEQGLRRLGNWVPRTRLGLGLGILRESIIQCWHSLLPFGLHRKPSSSQRHLTVRFFNRITHPYIFHNTLKLLWAGFSGMNRAELLPPSPHLAFCYALHACFMSMLGWQTRGARYGDRAIAMARENDDVLGYGHSCNYSGIGLYASARYEESRARLTEAVDGFAKAGDLYELHLARFHRGCCQLGLGNLTEAIAEARWVFASSARIGDTRTLCSSWLWARATRGNIPFGELKSCYPCRPDDIMSTVHGVLAEGLWHSFHGRTAEALQVFERAGEMVWNTFCVNSHTILVLPMLAGALRLHADAVQHKDARQCDQLRRRGYRVAKWATRITRLFPAAYPLSLRELSLLLAAQGYPAKALKLADRSCAVAEKQKAKYEHAQSLLVRGKLARELGLPEAQEQIRTAEQAIEAIEKAASGGRQPPEDGREGERGASAP